MRLDGVGDWVVVCTEMYENDASDKSVGEKDTDKIENVEKF